jgi:hypothetical protein
VDDKIVFIVKPVLSKECEIDFIWNLMIGLSKSLIMDEAEIEQLLELLASKRSAQS